MDRETIAALKVLTDATRLRMVGRLAESPATTEELVRELGLSTAVVVRQLGLLRRVGLIGATPPWSIRLDALQAMGRSLDEL
jgi:DNA-binding transcriptional ArsR family regulator